MGDFDGMAEYRHQRDLDAPPFQPGRVLGLAALAFLGLCAGFALINVTVTNAHWRPPLLRFDEIVEELETQKDQVDLLFFGPSHMMTDINPLVFDARATQLGYQVRSYNFSVEGLRVSEREYLLRELERIRPGQLKYVLVKPDLWLNTGVENVFSTRARFFNSPANVGRALTLRLDSSTRHWSQNIAAAGLILLGGLSHLSNVGVIADLILPPGNELADPPPKRHPERRGYVPLQNPHRKLPAGDDAPYPVSSPPLPARELSPNEKGALADLFRKIRHLGAQPVVLIPPVGNDNLAETDETLRALEESFEGIPTLTFHASGQSPELYRKLAYWEDMNHLSTLGSQVFSRLLAERFASFAKAREEAP